MMLVHGRKIVIGIIGVTMVVGLVVSTVWIQKFRYRPYLHEKLYLPSGKFVTEMSLGYREVVADVLWVSAVQYYGDFRKGNHDLRYFRGLIDIVTLLDPHFTFAYRFGALVISEDVGSLDEGMELLKLGMARNPRSWELPFEVAFLAYINGGDRLVAARYFELASKMPGAPESTRRFAAFVYSKAGNRESSMRLWEEYLEQTDNPHLKELAKRYIEKLKRSENKEKATSDA